MPNDRWPRIKEVLAAALEQPAEGRVALLDELCAGDEALRSDVESLLEADAAASASASFLEAPLLTSLVINAFEAEPNIGLKLGPYVIEQAIGRGGMGTVYVARRVDEEFERRVAIKMIRRGMDSEMVVRRFRNERQILASIDHPNVASLFDGGTTADGLPYFVMEYVAGTPIDDFADQHRLTTTARIGLCLPILDAVQHAHDRQIVHRDIKPSNVMVSADGHPKLLDFGIAKILDSDAESLSTLTSLGRPMTPDYASPEQLRGEAITAATDVYALGLLLYELLTGHRPFGDESHSPEAMARVIAEQDPERPSAVITRAGSRAASRDDGAAAPLTAETISATRDGSPALLRRRLIGPLDEILLKALRREPAERYPSVAALADDLRRYLTEQPVAVSWDARRYRTKRFVQRYRGAIAAAVLVLVAGGAGVLITRSAIARRSTTVAPTGQAAPRPSVAVIGFRNLSERAADQWLSTAIAEMLTTELGGDGQLRVLPGERVSGVRGDLDRSATAGVSATAIDRIRTALASDYAVSGTFAVTEGATPRALRIDVRIHGGGRDPISVAGTGDEGQLFALVAHVGHELRAQLGLRESSSETVSTARAAFPQTLEATRLYAEGMAQLRLLNAVAARDRLERAATLERDNPMIQVALASAWAALGYDARSSAAAQRAFDASSGLNREERLNVEGRLYEAQRKWPKAIEIYRTLWGFFSDNVEYGLRLASAQTAGGEAKEALTTVEAMRRLHEPDNQDPRIDLEEAQAAFGLGDFKHDLAAIQRAVAHAESSGARLVVARARLLEGRSYYNQGQLDPAQKSLTEAQQVFREVGDRAGAASALNSLATVAADQRDISSSERMYRQSLAASEEIGDRRAMSAALNNLGILLKDMRRFDEARRVHERALSLRREIAAQGLIATSLGNIGVVLSEQDRLREAATYHKQALEITREIGDRRGQVRSLHNLAIIDRQLGNLAAARTGYEESLATRTEIGDKRGTVVGRVELGMVLLAQGELELARQSEEAAQALSREMRLKPSEAYALYQLAEIARTSGDLAAARRLHEQALAIRREMNETRTALDSRMALAALALEEGRITDAGQQGRELAKELGSEGDRALRIAIEVLLARSHLAAGDSRAAERALAAARPLSEKTEQIEPRQLLTLAEAELDAAVGRNDRARARLTTLRASVARAGMVLAELECRAALLRLDRVEGRTTFRVDATTLQQDAKARGAGLILRRIQAL